MIPQRFRALFGDAIVDNPLNFVGVRREVHVQITTLWENFAARNPAATRDLVLEFAAGIEARFGRVFNTLDLV